MEQDLFAQIEELEREQEQRKMAQQSAISKHAVPQRDQPKNREAQFLPPQPIVSPPRLSPQPDLRPISRKEAMQASVDYFGGDELAATVWLSKYALKDSDGNIYERTPDDMHRRIARELARIELKYANPVAEADIYATLKDFRYIVPQGSPMAGIGNNFQVSSLSNCFVIGNGTRSDSYGGIMKIDQEQVQLMKRRGGVGHDLSHIRPAGSPVKNSALTSTGIVPFMERYSNSTREVAQDGRRGALMLTISIKHPDSEDFIDAKLEAGKVTGANVSVKIDDEFMQCVRDNKPYTQQFPIDADQPTYSKTIDARKLWNKIIHNAWRSAEPGILFWDTVIRESVPDSYADQGFTTVSTNPCGEIPLCPYDSCRLLAINLYSYVEQPFTENATFNRELFAKHAHVAQRMMDNIIDLEVEKVDGILHKIDSDPEGDEVKRVERKLWENIRKKTLQGRRTGIGITSEGDMLAALNLRYGTPEATSFSTDIHKLLATEVYRSSVALAKDRGAFEVFDFEKEKNNPFIQRLGNEDAQIIEDMKQHGRRNIALLTIAPTGSVSICTQTTSGIEPVFMPAYKRRRKVNPNDVDARITFVDDIGDSWEEYQVFHPKFDVWLRQHGHDPKEVRTYTETEIEKLVKKSPYYKATSNDIDWVEKVKMQGAVQKWVDHSISVTVNLPADATEELVSNVYMTAWESGCKGMTIYRDGSRSGVLVSNKKKDENAFKETQAPQRPRKLKADVMWFHNDEERWVAVVGLLDNRPYEIFTGKARGFFVPEWVTKGWVIKNKENNQSRYDFQFLDSDGYKITMEGLSRQFNKEYWNYAKLISGILRHGMPLPYVVDIVEKLVLDNDAINSWKKGIVRSLKKYIPDGTAVKKEACPDCGMEGTLEYKEGCKTCNSCNWTACS
jgi:ribonucleoside-diphosphate reductase alpha chain